MKPTINKKILDWYIIFWDILIGFSVFALFFAIFMNYFFMDYHTNLLVKMFLKGISFYGNMQNEIKYNSQNSENIDNLEKESNQKQKEIDNYNRKFENQFIIIIGIFIAVYLAILLIPVLIGFISYKNIPILYLILILLGHLTFVLGFELLIFFKHIFPSVIVIKIHKILAYITGKITYTL
jgi:hypothetical protein